eukprot:12894821-Prorocentrum_lima.AAC.1
MIEAVGHGASSRLKQPPCSDGDDGSFVDSPESDPEEDVAHALCVMETLLLLVRSVTRRDPAAFDE